MYSKNEFNQVQNIQRNKKRRWVKVICLSSDVDRKKYCNEIVTNKKPLWKWNDKKFAIKLKQIIFFDNNWNKIVVSFLSKLFNHSDQMSSTPCDIRRLNILRPWQIHLKIYLLTFAKLKFFCSNCSMYFLKLENSKLVGLKTSHWIKFGTSDSILI